MRNLILKLLTLFTAIVLLNGNVFAQGGRVVTEEDQLKQAEKYFDSKNYEKALPLFSQAVSNRPDNAYYNYCLGVCLLKVDGDKADAVRFLTIATQSSGVPLNAWLYLGMALHRAYRYEEAINTIQKYKTAVNRQVWTDSGGEQIIAMCHNAINLNNDLSLSRHSILQEYEVTRTDFFTQYKNIAETGRFLKLPKEYENKLTKDRFECSLLFLCSSGKEMVFTGPSVTGENGLDIFRVEKDASGLWKFPEPIGESVNTKGDEAFPVLVDNGKTLYFSSNGSRSTGGYDIFKSEFDQTTGKWSEPVGMGTPVNSPGDDYFYVPNPVSNSTYFSSDRESPSGKCKVYTASVIREDRSFVSINGSFHCPAALDGSEAKITVLNYDDRSLMAQFRSGHNGTYFMKLPVPSKLLYQVKIAGFTDSESLVDLSSITGGKVIQEIQLTRSPKGKESLVINTRVPETATPVVAQKTQPVENTETPVKNISQEKNPVSAEAPLADASTEIPNTNTKEVSQPLVSVVPVSKESKLKEASTAPQTKENSQPLVSVVPVTKESKSKDATTSLQTKENSQPLVSVVSVTKESQSKDTSTIIQSPVASTEPTITRTTETIVHAQLLALNKPFATKEYEIAVADPHRQPMKMVEPVIKEENTPEENTPLVSIISNTTPTPVESVKSEPEVETLPAPVPATEILTASKTTVAQATRVTTEKSKQKRKREKTEATQTNTVTPVAEPTPSTVSAAAPQNVIFKVQLGAFRGRDETLIRKKYESMGVKQLEFNCTDAGVLQVLTGNEISYENAIRLKEATVQQGFRDAFIVAYSGDQRLPMELAVTVDDAEE